MRRLTIEYCVSCNYYPRAAGLAEQLEKQFGLRPVLVKGSGGVFEVAFENELLFSKRQAHRFPEPGEVEAKLEARLDAGAAPAAGGS